ncbi:5-formyltetrahydrofolate cyclo-ligase [Aquifex sp.]
MLKERLRRKILDKRIALSEEERGLLSRKIAENLRSIPEYKRAKTVLLYCPVKGEPDLTTLFSELINRDALILPKVKGKTLELYKVNTLSCLKKGSFGIPEPEEGEKVSPDEVELFVVPGVVFDKEGYRLGFGKGYYDRLLRGVKSPKVGVAYSFQVIDKLPRDPWDIPVDIIITEKNIRRLKNGAD